VNVIKVTEHANWKYLWLLTDNDCASNFALKYILKIAVETDFDLMLWNFGFWNSEKLKFFHEEYLGYDKFNDIWEFSKYFWNKKSINLHTFGSNFSLYSIFFIKRDYFNYSKNLIDKNKFKTHYFPHCMVAFSHIENKIILKPNNIFTLAMWHPSSRKHCKKLFHDFKEVFTSFMWSKKITKSFKIKVRSFLFRYWLINFISLILNWFPFIRIGLKKLMSKNKSFLKLIDSILNPSI
jgi:hypothetical protein